MDGSANFLKAMSVPASVAVAIMGVLVASFAGTTLDTACRLQRYVIQELASTFVGLIAPAARQFAILAQSTGLADQQTWGDDFCGDVGVDHRRPARGRGTGHACRCGIAVQVPAEYLRRIPICRPRRPPADWPGHRGG